MNGVGSVTRQERKGRRNSAVGVQVVGRIQIGVKRRVLWTNASYLFIYEYQRSINQSKL